MLGQDPSLVVKMHAKARQHVSNVIPLQTVLSDKRPFKGYTKYSTGVGLHDTHCLVLSSSFVVISQRNGHVSTA